MEQREPYEQDLGLADPLRDLNSKQRAHVREGLADLYVGMVRNIWRQFDSLFPNAYEPHTNRDLRSGEHETSGG